MITTPPATTPPATPARPLQHRPPRRHDDLGRARVAPRAQEHDGALDRLLHRRETLPERETVASGEASLGVLSGQIGVLTGERDEIAHEEKRLDDEASTLREKAAEVEAKMYSGSVSSPRELQAMQADIDQLRRLQRNLERGLELMEA